MVFIMAVCPWLSRSTHTCQQGDLLHYTFMLHVLVVLKRRTRIYEAEALTQTHRGEALLQTEAGGTTDSTRDSSSQRAPGLDANALLNGALHDASLSCKAMQGQALHGLVHAARSCRSASPSELAESDDRCWTGATGNKITVDYGSMTQCCVLESVDNCCAKDTRGRTFAHAYIYAGQPHGVSMQGAECLSGRGQARAPLPPLEMQCTRAPPRQRLPPAAGPVQSHPDAVPARKRLPFKYLVNGLRCAAVGKSCLTDA